MTKILFWVVVILIMMFGLRLLSIAKAKRRKGSPPDPSRAPQAEPMVRCVLCGVYLPRAEAASGPQGLTCGDSRCTQKR